MSFGQTKSLNYQAVIMDPKPIEIPGTSITGQPLKNGKVNVRFTLLSKSGSVDYEEFHATTTDEFGLINLTIGSGFFGSSSGLSTQATTATYKSFDAIKWDANVKQLRVDLSFDAGKNYANVSTQPFNYTAYALYAESVEYKNVRDSPTTLSYFNNDVGYLVNRDLDPLKNQVDQNQKDAISKFLIVNQAITENEKVTAENSKKIGDISITVSSQGEKIEEQNNRINTNQSIVSNQITNISNQVSVTQAKVEEVANSYENSNNKSNNVQSDRSSTSKYPSVKAVKDYVDQATLGIALQATVDGKEDRQNKSVDIKKDSNPNVNYPTVEAVKRYVLESALSLDAQLIIDGKENVANKSVNVIADAGSDSKYPTVKAIKKYIDDTTLGKSLAEEIAGKEEKNNKVTEIGKDETNPSLYPTVLAVRKFVYDATIKSLTVEKQAIGIVGSTISLTGGENPSSITLPNADKNVSGLIQLNGDLGGTYSNPTVPALANKEDASNKVSSLVSPTNTTYPTSSAVVDYVTNSINSNKAADATTTANGIVRLAGDLAGTADAPLVKVDAITTAKIKDANVTDAKIEGMSSSKLIGEVSMTNGGTGASTLLGARTNLLINKVDNTSDAEKPISSATKSALDDKEALANKTSEFVKYADSEDKYPTIKSVKNYIDSKSTSSDGLVAAEKTRAMSAEDLKEDKSNKTSDFVIDADNEVKYPTIKSVKTYVDGSSAANKDLITAEVTRAKAEEILKEDKSNKTSDFVNDADNEVKYPTIKSVKTYVDGSSAANKDLITAEVTRAKAEEILKEDKSNKTSDFVNDADNEVKYPTIKSVKTYVDGSSVANKDLITAEVTRAKDSEKLKEDLINKSFNVLEDKESDIKYPSVKALVTYANSIVRAGGETSHDEIENEKNRAIGRENGLGEEISAEKKRSEDKDAEHKKVIDDNKTSQEAKNSEYEGKLTSHATSIADHGKAIADNKSAQEAKNSDYEGKLTSHASSITAHGTAIADNKSAQEVKNSEYEGKLNSHSTEITAHGAAISENKSAQEVKNSDYEGKLASHATSIAAHGTAIADNKSAQEAKNSVYDGKFSSQETKNSAYDSNFSNQVSKNSDYEGKLTSHASDIANHNTKLIEHGISISENNTSIMNEANARIEDIAKEKAARLALTSTVTGIQTSISAGVSMVGSTLTAGKIILGNASNIANAVSMSGDISINDAGVTTIGAGKITNSMLAGNIDLTSKVTGILPLANLPTDLSTKLGTANTNATGLLSSSDWTTFNGKQNAITVTSTGTSGAATFAAGTLNIPNYGSGNAAGFTGNLVGDVTGTQGATVVSKINGVSLAGLATGILKNTTSTGVPVIAVAADFPTLNQNTTGNAATATASTTKSAGDNSTNIATTAYVDRNTSFTTDAGTTGDMLIRTANGAVWATEFTEVKTRTSNNNNDHVYTLSSTPLAGTLIKVFVQNTGAKIRTSAITVSGTSVTINQGSATNPGNLEFYYYK